MNHDIHRSVAPVHGVRGLRLLALLTSAAVLAGCASFTPLVTSSGVSQGMILVSSPAVTAGTISEAIRRSRCRNSGPGQFRQRSPVSSAWTRGWSMT